MTIVHHEYTIILLQFLKIMAIKATTCFKITKESWNAEKFVLQLCDDAFSNLCRSDCQDDMARNFCLTFSSVLPGCEIFCFNTNNKILLHHCLEYYYQRYHHHLLRNIIDKHSTFQIITVLTIQVFLQNEFFNSLAQCLSIHFYQIYVYKFKSIHDEIHT